MLWLSFQCLLIILHTATVQMVSKQGSADIYMAVMIAAVILVGMFLAIISVTVCVFLCQKQWMTGQKLNIYTNSML